MSTAEKQITLVEFNAESVYVQYNDMDSESISYNKAKAIFKDLKYKIRYSSCGSTKAVEFGNTISSRKYLVTHDTIEPKPRTSLSTSGKKRW
ncbi:MAG: hypothetical protein M1300_07560 [Epsilonproteobacteria bacterium]|nr:hypothetical protein [Campylobacterota bacterium]